MVPTGDKTRLDPGLPSASHADEGPIRACLEGDDRNSAPQAGKKQWGGRSPASGRRVEAMRTLPSLASAPEQPFSFAAGVARVCLRAGLSSLSEAKKVPRAHSQARTARRSSASLDGWMDLHLPAAAAASKRIDDSTLSSFGPAPHSALHTHPSACFISLNLIPSSLPNSIAVLADLNTLHSIRTAFRRPRAHQLSDIQPRVSRFSYIGFARIPGSPATAVASACILAKLPASTL
ncbi:flavin-containing monooxygenase [Moesziomyces antarcticus T-34]|uniref:Flavin-containing monooxygenase n=1 Tax=Pseudozyma antarctica (strain T-34) TaxID=1151754 RepID=M9M1N6_PSEA3|nr:flavin-containing monooxygenase [Moesziomyces antarcticus T-34]